MRRSQLALRTVTGGDSEYEHQGNLAALNDGDIACAARVSLPPNYSEVRNPSGMTKTYYLTSSEIRELVPGRGSCIASDRILIDGARVGYLYREPPDNEIDSGWRFFSGDESQEYTDNASNFALYDVNTVANYDPQIIPLLDAPYGSAYERDQAGIFVAVDAPLDPDADG